MNLFEYLDETDLKLKIEDGLVREQKHPFAPLAILNYTPKAQFTPDIWNKTMDCCRGLIYNTDTFEVVARPFTKFWNFNDPRHEETLPANLPTTTPTITRKMDGSLGVGFLNPENGQWEIATRGSFTSDQAHWANDHLNPGIKIPEGYTPLFEIIYPENRIVLDYKGYEGLVVLGLVENSTGEEYSYGNLWRWANDNNLQCVRDFAPPLSDYLTEDDPDEEGYVVSWSRTGVDSLRVKIKFETYCKMHKIMTQTSAIGIWEMMRDLEPLDKLFENTPKEFTSWVSSVSVGLLKEEYNWLSQATTALLSAPKDGDRKGFAEYAKSQTPYTPLIFALHDKKDVGPMIWKMIRPTGNIRPFCNEEAV